MKGFQPNVKNDVHRSNVKQGKRPSREDKINQRIARAERAAAVIAKKAAAEAALAASKAIAAE